MTLNKSIYRFLIASFVIACGLFLTTYAQTSNKDGEKKLFDLGNEIMQTSQNTAQPNDSSKKAGVIRYGIVSAGGETASDAHSLAATVKLLELLDGKGAVPFDTVRLEAKLSHFIIAEASKKQCDYILYIEDVTNKKKKGMFGKIGDVVTKTIPGVPGLFVYTDDYWKLYRSGQKVMNASDLMTAVAGNTKAKDTTSVSYRLVKVSTKSDVIPSSKIEKKAKKNGENILESLVIQIGEDVLAKTVKP